MPSPIGTWVPFARQAIYGETPIRSIDSNDFATLDIRPGGSGTATRKGLFGQTLPLTWTGTEDYDIFIIDIDNGLMVLIAQIAGDTLITMLHASVPGLDGSSILFKKTA